MRGPADSAVSPVLCSRSCSCDERVRRRLWDERGIRAQVLPVAQGNPSGPVNSHYILIELTYLYDDASLVPLIGVRP